MQFKYFLVSLLIVAFINCAYAEVTIKTEFIYAPVAGNYAPVEASLYNINEKVDGYYLTTEIPDDFNEAHYKATVTKVCQSNPNCLKQAQTISDSFAIRARKVGDMFSVMLCDKEMKWKIMEDFSCNNMRVEVQSWKDDEKDPCKFEENWERIKKDYCNGN